MPVVLAVALSTDWLLTSMTQRVWLVKYTPVSSVLVLIAVTRTSHFRYATDFLLPRGPKFEMAGDLHGKWIGAVCFL